MNNINSWCLLLIDFVSLVTLQSIFQSLHRGRHRLSLQQRSQVARCWKWAVRGSKEIGCWKVWIYGADPAQGYYSAGETERNGNGCVFGHGKKHWCACVQRIHFKHKQWIAVCQKIAQPRGECSDGGWARWGGHSPEISRFFPRYVAFNNSIDLPHSTILDLKWADAICCCNVLFS